MNSLVKRSIAEEIHRLSRINYLRRETKILGLRDMFQADLIEMQPYQNVNRGFRYILAVIDSFSKYLWLEPVKQKTAQNVSKAMQKILDSNERADLKPPRLLCTDFGKEFENSEFKKLMEKYNVHMYHVFSNKKASIVERVIRSVKSLLYRKFSEKGNYKWLDLLPEVLDEYNSRIHRTIGIAPKDVSLNEEKLLLQRIKQKNQRKIKNEKAKFKINDTVRISGQRSAFEKGYLPKWSTELFTIFKIRYTTPITYEIKDMKGEHIKGIFYKEELQKTQFKDVYLVEKVLKKSKDGKKLFVSWLGFPREEASWILKTDLV